MKLYQKTILVVKTILGFILYYFFPRKKIILILSSMRSGSTLLKALLGEAKDVSHINEYNSQLFSNKYEGYFNVYKLSKSPIIILKKPSFYNDVEYYPTLPKYGHKKILLIRNPIETISSIQKMNTISKNEYNETQLIQYWAKTYTNIQNYINDDNIIVVRYSELTTSPLQITKNIFSFIDSMQKHGVVIYSKPNQGKWEWGKDDNGQLINTKQVIQNKKKFTPELAIMIHENQNIAEIAKQYKLNLYE
jgi:hypothetical protein